MSRVDNKEKYKEYDHQYYIKHKRPKSKIGQAEQKIADLEAKLAESEEKLKLIEDLRDVEETEYFEDISKTNSALFRKCQQTTRLIEENNQLKQQLAEKDLKITQLETKLNLKDNGTNV